MLKHATISQQQWKMREVQHILGPCNGTCGASGLGKSQYEQKGPKKDRNGVQFKDLVMLKWQLSSCAVMVSGCGQQLCGTCYREAEEDDEAIHLIGWTGIAEVCRLILDQDSKIKFCSSRFHRIPGLIYLGERERVNRSKRCLQRLQWPPWKVHGQADSSDNMWNQRATHMYRLLIIFWLVVHPFWMGGQCRLMGVGFLREDGGVGEVGWDYIKDVKIPPMKRKVIDITLGCPSLPGSTGVSNSFTSTMVMLQGLFLLQNASPCAHLAISLDPTPRFPRLQHRHSSKLQMWANGFWY